MSDRGAIFLIHSLLFLLTLLLLHNWPAGLIVLFFLIGSWIAIGYPARRKFSFLIGTMFWLATVVISCYVESARVAERAADAAARNSHFYDEGSTVFLIVGLVGGYAILLIGFSLGMIGYGVTRRKSSDQRA